ncbi:ArgS-related anticodon-binding protein NrtL [Streptomyces sp. NPDC050636]|uniref:ArgS-related anticodon-binding protein NrtL n=1 Tax=Streptomyces sp. NPDC050636 TaxID=3154510 RepID=UPI00342318F9
MTPAELSRTVLRSVRGAVAERELSVSVPERIVVQPPPRAGCGDYASNVALRLAKQAGRPALEVAEILRRRLAGSAGIARVEIAGPGFLNFTLGDGARAALVRDVLAQGPAYGSGGGGGELAADELVVGDLPAGEPPAGDLVNGDLLSPALHGARALVVANALGRLLPAAGMGRPTRKGAAGARSAGDGELAGLVARLGADEARWALLRPAAHDPVRLPERPVQRESNPRFRVQYAYARTRALSRNARELGFESEPGDVLETAAESADGTTDSAHLPEAPQQSLHTLLATYPRTVEAAARYRAPDRMVRHLEATADAFFRWQDVCPPLPVGERKPLAVHRARLALAEATGTVLANGLRLLGISAPEHL